MKRMTREWVRKTEDDFRAAEILVAEKEALHDQVCFHCQQAAEKYFKALLQELGLAATKEQVLAVRGGINAGPKGTIIDDAQLRQLDAWRPVLSAAWSVPRTSYWVQLTEYA